MHPWLSIKWQKFTAEGEIKPRYIRGRNPFKCPAPLFRLSLLGFQNHKREIYHHLLSLENNNLCLCWKLLKKPDSFIHLIRQLLREKVGLCGLWDFFKESGVFCFTSYPLPRTRVNYNSTVVKISRPPGFKSYAQLFYMRQT